MNDYNKIIDKACDWLMNEAHWEYYLENGFPLEKIVEDFKNAMKR